MKHYLVIAELVDDTSGKRFMPGDTFMPASEKQRSRLTNAGCLGDEEVDPLDNLGDLPLGTLSREHLENIAFGIARQTIAAASDDDLRDGIESHRERRAAPAAAEGHHEESSGGGQSGGADEPDDLDQQTVDQLKKIADDEKVDLTGKTLKGAIVTAIRAARGERADAMRSEG